MSTPTLGVDDRQRTRAGRGRTALLLVAGALLAVFVAVPLLFLALASAVDSVSPTVDTARWFSALTGGVVAARAAVALVPFGAGIRRVQRRWPLGADYARPAAIAAATLAAPAFVDGARSDSPPADALFSLGAVGLTIALTILVTRGFLRALRTIVVIAGILILAVVVLLS